MTANNKLRQEKDELQSQLAARLPLPNSPPSSSSAPKVILFKIIPLGALSSAHLLFSSPRPLPSRPPWPLRTLASGSRPSRAFPIRSMFPSPVPPSAYLPHGQIYQDLPVFSRVKVFWTPIFVQRVSLTLPHYPTGLVLIIVCQIYQDSPVSPV